jgi:hypothetical protein
MTGPSTVHPWMTHVAPRISASPGLPVAPPEAAPCVLDLLDRARPQRHTAKEPIV